MLKCATSLWSADLANLETEIRRIEPYSDRFHLDVADGHFVQTLLFFPDLVKALRKYTTLPFEVHLMTERPIDWIDPFVEAGGDRFIFFLDSTNNPVEVIRRVKAAQKQSGISLTLDEPVELLQPFLDDIDTITLMGTAIGIKGASMDERIPAKIAAALNLCRDHGRQIEIEVDGGIRHETVPLIHAAGADTIVPGSLMFGGNPEELRAWLASL